MRPPEEIAQAIDHYMRFRSVFEAYRIMQPAPGGPLPGAEPVGATGQPGPAMEMQGPPPTSGTPPMPETAVR
jgi:hypothetical protein